MSSSVGTTLKGTHVTVESLSRLTWRRGQCDTGACVEAAFVNDQVLIRDSKDPEGAVLRFDHEEWKAFLAGVADGSFDLDR